MSNIERLSIATFAANNPNDESESQEEEAIKEERNRELRDHLATIIKVVSGHLKLRVTTEL